MKKTVIFDMDGTLFQTNKILEASLVDTFDHLARAGKWQGAVPLKEYQNIMGVPLPKVWETLMPDHSEGDRLETDRYFLESLIANIHGGKGALYPNVTELFERLGAEGCPIYIASNGLKRYLAAIADHYKLDRWVAGVYSIEEIDSLNKSDLVGAILAEAGNGPAVMVGDRLSDFNAGRDNNIPSIGCRFDFAREEELACADYVIDNLLDVVEIMNKTEYVTE